MNATWYTAALRWVGSTITRLADDLDAPSCYAAPLEWRDDLLPPYELLTETRNRLSRYY